MSAGRTIVALVHPIPASQIGPDPCASAFDPRAAAEWMRGFERGEAVTLRFSYPDTGILRLLQAVCAKLLARMDLVYLRDAVQAMLRELVFNASKANAKRLHFQDLGLDITDAQQYACGLARFRDYVDADRAALQQRLEASEYRVEFRLTRTADGATLSIANNAPALPVEWQRAQDRMQVARACDDLGAAFDQVFDGSEGAGLGLALITLLLKHSGIGVEAFRLTVEEGMTRCDLTIPAQIHPVEVTTAIKRSVLLQIDGLPSFPTQIVELLRLCADPDSSSHEIARRLTADPAVTVEVLRLSSAAGQRGAGRAGRVLSVHEAVKSIGLKRLSAILMASTARRIMDQRFPELERVWKHCNKVGAYAASLADLAPRPQGRADSESAFLCGLMHDLGKVVLLGLDREHDARIRTMLGSRRSPHSTALEEAALGISHATIGALLARKWQFPEVVCQSIRFHHAPLSAAASCRETVYLVYLANLFCGIEAGHYDLVDLEADVLEHLGMTHVDEAGALHEAVRSRHESNLDR